MSLVSFLLEKRLHTLIPMVLVFVIAMLTIAYWTAALEITGRGCGNCEYWAVTPGGGYLPWPWHCSLCLEATNPMNDVDRIFCRLINSNFFVLVVFSQILGVGWVSRLVVRRIDWYVASRDMQKTGD